ncbi:MAG TPA: BON domain-containing protein [Vicinamibacterales bacterium]|nr:BON domain-containing protein [Vicinamibacterales bacterium]
MIRGLLKLILLVIVVVAVGMFFLGWNAADDRPVQTAEVDEAREAVGTTGQAAAERGREVGAEVGERAGQAADATRRAIEDGSLTAKIKAKMALDDTVKALNLDVDTFNGTVTVKGVVRTEAERQRALQLARETEGVRQVVDQLTLR